MPGEIAKNLIDLYYTGLAAGHPDRLMTRLVRKFQTAKIVIGDLEVSAPNPVKVLGFGKASVSMFNAFCDSIGLAHIGDALVIKHVEDIAVRYPTPNVRQILSSHPKVSDASFIAGEAALQFAKGCSESDLVVNLVSGGGSAMMAKPHPNFAAGTKQSILSQLLTSGVPEREINVIRREMSLIKGGRLGAAFAPARMINIILSDERSHSFPAIASGPTVESDDVTAISIIEKYNLSSLFDQSTLSFFKNGLNRGPKQLPNLLGSFLLGTRDDVVHEIIAQAPNSGFDTAHFIGNLANIDAAEAVSFFQSAAQSYCASQSIGNHLLIATGEIPVKVVGVGKGGRNQHIAASMLQILGKQGIVGFAALATDGCDFIPGVHGAAIDEADLRFHARNFAAISQAIDRTDTHNLLGDLGSLVKGQATGTNVSDIFLIHVRLGA